MATLELVYRLHPADGVAFAADAAPQQRAEPLFRLRLAGGVATFTMTDPDLPGEEACRITEQYADAWRIHAGVAAGRPLGHFVFAGMSRVSDHGISVTPAPATARASAAAVVPPIAYPEPPRDFVVDDDVATMWFRYERYQRGGEPLLSMAAFCLNVLEMAVGWGRSRDNRRDKAAQRYGIDKDLLDKLGDVTAEGGDRREARKWDPDSRGLSLRAQQRAEVDRLARLLIRRAGEHAADPARVLPRVGLIDFPALSRWPGT
jgi:hypothetical protein